LARPASASGRSQGGVLASVWANYSLSLVLLALFIATFALHGVFGWLQYVSDQVQQGDDATLWGPNGYWIYFGEWTLQNWQSEFLEALTIVAVTAWFIHRGSPESKDGQHEMSLALSRIEHRLERIEKAAK
jgi:Domain of unknown function (DUF6766)